jgi:hypothetical protein
VGRGDAGERECGAYDYEATEVDPGDYVWRNGEPIGLAVNFTGVADEEVDWADLEEEWEELEARRLLARSRPRFVHTAARIGCPACLLLSCADRPQGLYWSGMRPH